MLYEIWLYIYHTLFESECFGIYDLITLIFLRNIWFTLIFWRNVCYHQTFLKKISVTKSWYLEVELKMKGKLWHNYVYGNCFKLWCIYNQYPCAWACVSSIGRSIKKRWMSNVCNRYCLYSICVLKRTVSMTGLF